MTMEAECFAAERRQAILASKITAQALSGTSGADLLLRASQAFEAVEAPLAEQMALLGFLQLRMSAEGVLVSEGASVTRTSSVVPTVPPPAVSVPGVAGQPQQPPAADWAAAARLSWGHAGGMPPIPPAWQAMNPNLDHGTGRGAGFGPLPTGLSSFSSVTTGLTSGTSSFASVAPPVHPGHRRASNAVPFSSSGDSSSNESSFSDEPTVVRSGMGFNLNSTIQPSEMSTSLFPPQRRSSSRSQATGQPAAQQQPTDSNLQALRPSAGEGTDRSSSPGSSEVVANADDLNRFGNIQWA